MPQDCWERRLLEDDWKAECNCINFFNVFFCICSPRACGEMYWVSSKTMFRNIKEATFAKRKLKPPKTGSVNGEKKFNINYHTQ